MNIQKISIAEIKANPKNPRVIRDDKFQKLVQSIQDFPEMLDIRPLVLDENNIVLGGNMRLRALQELGFKEVPVLFAKNLSEKQKEEFIVKDNVSYGDWDWTALKELDTSELDAWGITIPQFDSEIDYSVLDETDVKEQLSSMASGVKKSIQIEFEPEDYEEAYEVIKFWRERKAYVGSMIVDFLKEEKNKL